MNNVLNALCDLTVGNNYTGQFLICLKHFDRLYSQG